MGWRVDNYVDNSKISDENYMKYMQIFIIGLALILLMPSCRTTKIHQRTDTYELSDTSEVQTEKESRRIVDDSTLVADTIYVTMQGDTIRVKEVHWRTRVKYVSRMDSTSSDSRKHVKESADKVEKSVKQVPRLSLMKYISMFATLFLLWMAFVWRNRKS